MFLSLKLSRQFPFVLGCQQPDATNLSKVHPNRVVQHLKALGLRLPVRLFTLFFLDLSVGGALVQRARGTNWVGAPRHPLFVLVIRIIRRFDHQGNSGYRHATAFCQFIVFFGHRAQNTQVLVVIRRRFVANVVQVLFGADVLAGLIASYHILSPSTRYFWGILLS